MHQKLEIIVFYEFLIFKLYKMKFKLWCIRLKQKSIPGILIHKIRCLNRSNMRADLTFTFSSRLKNIIHISITVKVSLAAEFFMLFV